MNCYRVGLIVEQSLGHVTHGLNIAAAVSQDPSIQAFWGLPSYQASGIAAHIPVYRGNWTVRAGLRTRKILADIERQSSLDVLFLHTQVVAVLAQDWMRRIPSIVSVDATPNQIDRLGAYYNHELGPRFLERIKWRLTRDCFRTAKHIVAWSQWAADGMIEEYEVPPEKVTVIPPGVVLSRWLCPPRYPTQGDPVKILFVGGDFQRKGGDILLQVFRRLQDEISNKTLPDAPRSIELHLVTRDMVKEEPGVFVYNHMQPNSDPLVKLFFDSDIFCMPTNGDTLVVALAEAGAAGLPVIASRVGGIPEVVKDGETGLIVQPGDAEALYIALRQLVTNPKMRYQLGVRGQAWVCERYDTEKNVRHLFRLFKQVAGDKPVEGAQNG